MYSRRLQKLNEDAMTLAAMRYQVDVAALQSEKSKLASQCEHESDAKQQLQIFVVTAYNIPFISSTHHPSSIHLFKSNNQTARSLKTTYTNIERERTENNKTFRATQNT